MTTVQRTGTTNATSIASTTYTPPRFNPGDRRTFIGGSDARVVMGGDEADLIRLWREKRGEIEPEDLNDNLIVQVGRVTEHLNRRWYERNSGHVIKDVEKHIQESRQQMDGGDTRRHGRTIRRSVRSQIHAALGVLGRGRRRKTHGPAAA